MLYDAISADRGRFALLTCPKDGIALFSLSGFHESRSGDIHPRPRHMMEAQAPCAGQKVVLVVEDNETARWILAEILAGEGYAVCEASSADEALLRLAERSDIRAVVTDIEMPGSMDGLEMAALIRSQSPEIAVLLTSGRRQPEADALPPATRFILKPWLPEALIRELELVVRLTGDSY